MGIKIEFNPDLALRNYSEYEAGRRKKEECLPEILEVGKIYPFLKEGQRNYFFKAEVPLLETKGNEVLSRPLASILILEATHFIKQEKMFTSGKFQVVEVFKDDKIHFEGFNKPENLYQ